MLTWCMAHPFMTFLLAFWAITCLYEVVYAIMKTVRIAYACKYKNEEMDGLEPDIRETQSRNE